MRLYNEDFFATRKEDVRSSARVIVPLVLNLTQPRSVIDVGCGTGEWLSVFREYGVEDIWGVDGSYVRKEMLEIPEERFIASDLEQPLQIGREFDLVVSLEVAEHLRRECAEIFVNSLTKLGPVVLFSAAIPNQGGVGHINEQWLEYWAQRFRDRDYVAIDCVRGKIWYEEKIKPHYAQNTLIFAARTHLENQRSLRKEYELRSDCRLSMVHPKMYLHIVEEMKVRNRLMRNVKKLMPPKVKRLVRAVITR